MFFILKINHIITIITIFFYREHANMINKSKKYNLAIFGATGDLSRRKLFPALYQLEKKKLINNMRIIHISRSYCNVNEYIDIMYCSLKKFLNMNINKKIWKKLKKRFLFCQMDINKIQDFKKLKKIIKKKNGELISYFAVSSDMFVNICKGLKFIYMHKEKSKIVIEKPIGKSLKTFHFINQSIKKYFSEKKIFRIDHYLGKESILNLITLKFFNPFFNNNLNKKYIDHIQITLSEELGIGDRWNYFNSTGQIIDMVQNHVLQIVSIFAMNIPKSLNPEDIKNEKIKILKKIRVINNKNYFDNISLGQYSDGINNNHLLVSYLNEKGAEKTSFTETFVAIKLYIDNKTWQNIPFYIRTGKRMPKKCSKIVVFFKKQIHNLFKMTHVHPIRNSLTINLQSPFEMKINFLNKKPELNSKFSLRSCNFLFDYKKIFNNYDIPEEYERLLLEVIKGNQFLFVHPKEIIYAWKWIDPIIKLYKQNSSLLQYYPAGTWGPKSSEQLIEKDKKTWDNN